MSVNNHNLTIHFEIQYKESRVVNVYLHSILKENNLIMTQRIIIRSLRGKLKKKTRNLAN